ncbi:NAD(P)H-dependent oxidoreductase [Yoonia sp.]|jgi:NAD(P)H dehydrogenase (quinone)|uniref:NAD(P)H-dependent oxidoreductase n=1 Tax=Yoonia sp. TaxID=2212373 RepID=UPI0025DA6FF6|nr:NAD(P)H-dependent oxidoreductase [Yoonia sp.]
MAYETTPSEFPSLPTTLIVLAHPDNGSFNGAWADATEQASAALGHTVLWSDLNAMGFDPVEGPQHYNLEDDGAPFDPLKAQENAASKTGLPGDVSAEIRKIQQADRIIFHFPLWWFSPPAILKGWCERVLVNGALHSVDQRFDTGLFRDKKALFCVTTGSKETESAYNGKEGNIDMLLWPMAYTLRYLGFQVLDPKTVHGVHGYHKGIAKDALHARLQLVLSAQHDVIADFDDQPVLHFNADSDFDDHGQLKTTRPSLSPFIRHGR